MKKGQQQDSTHSQATDPDRALQAARECRAAAREVHEAIQGGREVIREMRAVAAESQAVVAEARAVVPDEVKLHLDVLVPMVKAELEGNLGQIFTLCEQLQAKTEAIIAAINISQDGDPAVLPEMICPHCGGVNERRGTFQKEGDEADAKPPRKGDFSLCARCREVSVYDTDPTGVLIQRKPNLPETKQISKNALVKKMMALTHPDVLQETLANLKDTTS